jgi:hypothetical protein
MKTWVGIDYAGWEQICFETMEWRFDCPGQELDERKLQRVDDKKWLITDDYGDWTIYGGIEETECLESFYQSWVAKQMEREFLTDSK